jgi:GAF domain-containing protein
MLEELQASAALLATRLEAIGDHLEESSWDRVVRASIFISGVTDTALATDRLVRCLRDASRMDSAALILDSGTETRVEAAIGPLERAFHRLTGTDLQSISSLVDDIRSCYTGSDAVGRGFVGSATLRDGGARVVVVLPLWAHRVRIGSVVMAHSKPLQLQGEEVRALELLADHVASALASIGSSRLLLQPPAP